MAINVLIQLETSWCNNNIVTNTFDKEVQTTSFSCWCHGENPLPSQLSNDRMCLVHFDTMLLKDLYMPFFLWKMIENLRTFSSNIFGLKSKFFRHFYFLDVCRFYSSTLGLAVKFLRHKIEMGWTESGLRYARQKNYSGDTKTKPWPPSGLCF